MEKYKSVIVTYVHRGTDKKAVGEEMKLELVLVENSSLGLFCQLLEEHVLGKIDIKEIKYR